MEAPLWHGLDKTFEDLRTYCRKRDDVRSLINGEVAPAKTHAEAGATGGRGNKALTNSHIFPSHDYGPPRTPKGPDTQIRILAELKRDHPEMAERVISGELTARKAALIAGIRRPKIQLVTDDLDMAARTLVRHFNGRIDDLITAIGKVRNA